MSEFENSELTPAWFAKKTLDEVIFCCEFLRYHPMVCVGGSFYTKDGKVSDEEGIRRKIYEELSIAIKHGLARKSSNLLEVLKLEAHRPSLPIHEDRIHTANGTVFLDGEFKTEKEFCRNRLPVRYNPDAPQPEAWLLFLHQLLDDTDILTLQEYLGYCLIPSTRGQAMLLIKGNGGEGKSRIGVVMQKLLGSNLKNGSIAKVEHSPFARADLEGQLVMVDDDMKMEALKSTHSFVPLTADKRLCAKEIVGNKKKLTEWQDAYWKHMVKKYPNLERGESASTTGRTHIPLRLYKEAVHLNHMKEQIMALMAETNPFNKKAKEEELDALLDRYIPGVEAMRTKLKKYDARYKELLEENKKLDLKSRHSIKE